MLGGRYTLTERIGSGGMGAVWRADDEVLARQVAVKILHPALLEDGTFASRFRREAQLLAALRHPGIVDIHDYGENGDDSEDRVAYIVMELIDGQPLHEVLAENGPMPAGQALGLLATALDALHAAHQQDIVHRDLKPSNLMLRGDGQVTVTDFGIARAMASTKITASHAVLGTALYMAPEQSEGAAATPASDLYSIGVVCYELLTGEAPFTGESVLEIVLKHIREPAPELPAAFSQAVRDFAATALAKRPEDRFDDAAMAAAARAAIGDGSVAAAPAAPAVPAAPVDATPVAPVVAAPAADDVGRAGGVPRCCRAGPALEAARLPGALHHPGDHHGGCKYGPAHRPDPLPVRGERARSAAIRLGVQYRGYRCAVARGFDGRHRHGRSPRCHRPTEHREPAGEPGAGQRRSGGRAGQPTAWRRRHRASGQLSGPTCFDARARPSGADAHQAQGLRRHELGLHRQRGRRRQGRLGQGRSGRGHRSDHGRRDRLRLGAFRPQQLAPIQSVQHEWPGPRPGDERERVPLDRFSYLANWKVEGASTPGAYYLKDYMGDRCLTDEGLGRQLTMTACTPGNKAQEWRIP
ncbi:protein kinase [Streptomyces sp. H10-C2]|uniref:protein kinase domain-containing protein n=1 Tax=unclassified Streptomyces TaxID=2593676 RepID=UPI0024BA974E|nr:MULTISPECIES: protein kinase [unclassified Streptomyces]MDJ0340964.1 protein kinase [Streptomyces sp. PH10-H1]MDJ0369804.1 protein kinase [Streptomyces sp. H10-C2]